MIALRLYQRQAVDAILAALQQGQDRQLVAMPTGDHAGVRAEGSGSP